MSYAHPEYLIEPNELARLSDVKIFDATVHFRPADQGQGYRVESGFEAYQEAHIPGAAFLDHFRAVSLPDSGRNLTLPNPARLQASLRALGLSNCDRVVVYSTGHLMWATRAWWLLHYAGVRDVRVLNGGLSAWIEADHPTAAGIEMFEPGDLEVPVREERFVDQNYVRSTIGNASVCTVNALSPDIYAGTAEMSYGRKGHITGSVNLYFEDLLDGGRFKPAEVLKAVLAERGLLEAARVVAYCGGGVSATIDALACLLVGQESVAVYDGSMSEWGRDARLPVTEGEAPG